jgi:hypothetical protein
LCGKDAFAFYRHFSIAHYYQKYANILYAADFKTLFSDLAPVFVLNHPFQQEDERYELTDTDSRMLIWAGGGWCFGQ